MVPLIAVLLRYYPERDNNLRRLIDDLLAGSVVPDQIVVWDQSCVPPIELPVATFRSPTNFGSQAIYSLAALWPGAQFLFCDDDLTVGPKTVEALLYHGRPSRVVGMRGRYGQWPDTAVWPDHEWCAEALLAPRPADWLIGRIHLVGWEAILRYLHVATRLTQPFHEDAVMSAVNDCVIIPASADELYRDLDECGVGKGLDEDADITVRCQTIRQLEDLGWI